MFNLKITYCAVTKYLLETNGYNPQAQENIRNTKADGASLWTGPISINQIHKKKTRNMYKAICQSHCQKWRQIQNITHWGEWQEKSLQHFRGKIVWGMSVYIFIDMVWTEICKQPFLTQSYIQYNTSVKS